MKIVIKLSALVFLLVLGLGAHLAVGYVQDRSLEGTLTEAIASSDIIVVEDLVKFEWNEMHVFGAYTPEEVIDETIGFKYGKGGALQDGYLTILFTRGDKVIRHAVIPNYSGDNTFLDRYASGESFTPSEAVFEKVDNEFQKK